MADLFISYAREDKARADQVAQGLAAQGLDVFWDSEIPPGQTWADYIEEKLSNSAAVIVLWSEHSTKSHWVREEARMGRERGKLIPAALDRSPPPFGFAEVQSADLSSWTGQPNHPDWERFVAAVKSAVARRGQGGAAPRPTPPPPQPQPTIQPAWSTPDAAPADARPAAPARNWAVWAVGGVAVAALLAVFAALGGQSDAPSGADQGAVTADAPQAPSGNPIPQGVMTPSAPGATPTAPPAAGQTNMPDQYRQQLDVQLAGITQELAQQGFQPIGQPFYGGLMNGAAQRIPPTVLQQGGDYRVIGVCDNDCRDLDLVLVDENQVEIARDTSTDDVPVVASQPAWTGPFHIDVTMYRCEHAQGCYYALLLYGRAAQ